MYLHQEYGCDLSGDRNALSREDREESEQVCEQWWGALHQLLAAQTRRHVPATDGS